MEACFCSSMEAEAHERRRWQLSEEAEGSYGDLKTANGESSSLFLRSFLSHEREKVS